MVRFLKSTAVLVASVFLLAQVASAEEVGFDIIKTHPGDVMSIYSGDFDDDDNSDIIYCGIVNGLYILYGNSDGTFDPPVNYLDTYQSIIYADYVDKDKMIDIIVSSNHYVHVFLNKGNRDFEIISLPKDEQNLGGVATGYFNDDKKLDIIAAPSHIYLGDGWGNFPDQKALPEILFSFYVSDFNNDGKDDFLGWDDYGKGGIYINDGDADFTKTATIDLSGLTLQISSLDPFIDFNNDGNADFALVTPKLPPSSRSDITIGYGDGSGGLNAIGTLTVYGTSYSLAVADINRDNNLDIAASNATTTMLEVFLGDGNGHYDDTVKAEFETDSVTHALTAGDIDRDGNPDFVTGAFWHDSIVVALNSFSAQPVLEKTMTVTGYSNVTVGVTNPEEFIISKGFTTVAGADYRRLDINYDNEIDEQAVDYNLQYGEYKIILKKKFNADENAEFSATVTIGDEEAILFKDYEAPPLVYNKDGKLESDSIVFYFDVEPISSIQPKNGQTVDSDRPTFDWSGLFDYVPPGSQYTFQLDSYHDFRSPIFIESGIEVSHFTLESPLMHDAVYYWRVGFYNSSGSTDFSNTFAVYIPAKPTDVDDEENSLLPDQFRLGQNHPNPFNMSTQVIFSIPQRAHVELVVYNLLGQKIKVLENSALSAGYHTALWEGTNENGQEVAGGIYFYQLKAGDFVQSKKMVLLK